MFGLHLVPSETFFFLFVLAVLLAPPLNLIPVTPVTLSPNKHAIHSPSPVSRASVCSHNKLQVIFPAQSTWYHFHYNGN